MLCARNQRGRQEQRHLLKRCALLDWFLCDVEKETIKLLSERLDLQTELGSSYLAGMNLSPSLFFALPSASFLGS